MAQRVRGQRGLVRPLFDLNGDELDPGHRAHAGNGDNATLAAGEGGEDLVGAELYGGNWNSRGFLSENEFAAHVVRDEPNRLAAADRRLRYAPVRGAAP
jgi:hypothetical protein